MILPMLRALRLMRRLMRSPYQVTTPSEDTQAGSSASFPLFRQAELLQQARIGIYLLYAFQLVLALRVLPQWDGMVHREGLIALWPLFWIRMIGLDPQISISFILCLFLGGSLLGACLPGCRTGRILAFLGLFQFVAWNNSYGKIGHSLHVLLFISFLLIFLPRGWNSKASRGSRSVRMQTLLTYWCAQAVPLLAYTMAGLIKVICGVLQFFRGEFSIFGPEGLPRHVAARLLQNDVQAPLGPWVIDHPWLVMPAMWITLYLEFFAIYALFRPSTRLVFAGGLLTFHIASYFTMTIIFPENCFLLLILMLGLPACSPSPISGLKLKSLRDLPLVSLFASGMVKTVKTFTPHPPAP